METKTFSLWELAEAYHVLSDLSEDNENGEWAESLNSIQDDFTSKACNVAKAIRNLQATETAYKAEAERMQKAAQSAGNRAKWLLDYLKANMLEANVAKTDTVDVPAQFLPEPFCRTETRCFPDKDAILQAYKAGTWEPIKGVTITIGYHIRIK